MNRPPDEKGNFLSRWARLKQEARTAPPPAMPEPATPTVAEPAEPNAGERNAASQDSETAPLPSLDQIVPGADVTAFLARGVPEALRNAALRKLWVTDPAIRDFIEMADYQWDFNNPDSIPGWSSRLDGVDVEAMARRILAGGADAPAEPIHAALQHESVDPPASRGSSDPIGETTETADVSEALPAPPEAPEEHGTADVAVQDSTKESYAYVAGRRRHGGAVPT
jgi:hypothetical protein